ncbi:hypothetical protein ACS0TY_004866 [Phlomoides rotata]
MDPTVAKIIISIIVAASATWFVKLLDFLWFRPRKIEKILRNQGLDGSPYRPFLGDLKDYIRVIKEKQSRSIEFLDDILPHIYGYYHSILTNHGPNSFFWLGPNPRLIIADPKLVKEILSKPDVYQKPFPEHGKRISGGLNYLEGEKWTKHRKIVNSAFHLDKLKSMMQAMNTSCRSMIHKWEGMCNKNGGCEIDVWPYLEDFTGDVISRTAFGSSYEEGRKIFQLQTERIKLTYQLLQMSMIPGWRYLPTKVNRKEKAIRKEIQCLVNGIIEKKVKVIERGEAGCGEDLLGIMMETNSRFIAEDGRKNAGMSIEDVIEECKLFYVAGSDTTSSLLVWTMVLLSTHPEWQTRAREEVVNVLGNSDPSFEALNHLNIVKMILHEVLRLYPSVPLTDRGTTETVKLGNLTLPAGVHLALLIAHLHHDPEIWGEDAKEFNPQRFSEGVPKAAKMQSAFIPFSSGPRFCIGQNYTMIEAKIALSMILRRFSFKLSPSYLHAPFSVITLQPKHGAPLILHRLEQ